ncbi:MAG TPA: LssY C-terminal domain-containing protein [Bryobacteraceae bacterium]|nr:LssY C-terminal domain-containing protein [Bryobacteraceae bacterium]
MVAPVASGQERVILNAATLLGVVTESIPVGLGVRHNAAVLNLRFHSIRLANGSEIPADAEVVSVETAREHVDDEGRVIGIDPVVNLSSAVSLLVSTGLLQAGLIPAAIVFKLLAVRSPDPEIFFPKGTELLVRLTQDVPLDVGESGDEIKPLSTTDMLQVRGALSRLPVQQAELTHSRAADPVNIALIGTPGEVESAFRTAGWSGEAPHSALSLYRLYRCLVQRMGYRTAPMSRLTLDGVLPTSSYQKSLDTIARRHHVRFWRQGSTDIWLGAATEDIGLTVSEMHVTHIVDGQVDNERAKVADDLWSSGCVAGGSAMPRPSFFPTRHNGTTIDTDGFLAVIRLRDCQASAVLEKQTAAHVSRFRVAWHALVRDTLRANPVTVGLAVGRSFPHWRTSGAGRSLSTQSFRRPSIVN